VRSLPIIFPLLALTGCTVENCPAAGPLYAAVDFKDFACKVDRVVARRCSMLACHGSTTTLADGTPVNHAFRVYAPGKLRLGGWSTLEERSAPTTYAELQANFASARGLTYGAQAVADVPLIRKTIAPSLGGGEHMGGVIFRRDDDPDLTALRAWAGGETMPDGCDVLTRLQGQPAP
jgi:hypothetical protein